MNTPKELNVGELIWWKGVVWVIAKVGKAQLSCVNEANPEQKQNFTINGLWPVVVGGRDPWHPTGSGKPCSREEADRALAQAAHAHKCAEDVKRFQKELVSIPWAKYKSMTDEQREEVASAIKKLQELLHYEQ